MQDIDLQQQQQQVMIWFSDIYNIPHNIADSPWLNNVLNSYTINLTQQAGTNTAN